jgi:imidazoleglycerol-phosphate dehydratase
MLTQVAVHGLFDLKIQAEGDLDVDAHHTVEDVALTLGKTFDQALGERRGLVRMASSSVPMDESLAMVSLDLSGRPYTVFEVEWYATEVGGISTTLIKHFFESFAIQARCNLHIRLLSGGDDHHRAEAIFKAFGRALDAATRIDPRRLGDLPSSKGVL